jgi:hypothetical protein
MAEVQKTQERFFAPRALKGYKKEFNQNLVQA